MLNRAYFTESGDWLVPKGVTHVILIGCGAGGGGSGGAAGIVNNNSQGGSGGGGGGGGFAGNVGGIDVEYPSGIGGNGSNGGSGYLYIIW